MAGNYATMLATRLVMGGGEAATNPSGAQVVREWIPVRERGVTNACFNGGGYAGPALCSLAAGPIISAFGWHALFYIPGAIGLVWMVIWSVWFRSPENAAWLTDAERHAILATRADAKAVDDGPRTGLWRLLTSGPTLFSLGLAMGCNVYSLYVFLTWIPSYLHTTKGLTLSGSGLYTAILYGTALVLSLAIGRYSDHLLKGKDVSGGGRRYLIACTMALAAIVLFAPAVDSLPLLFALLALSLTGVAATTSQLFSLANDLLPERRDIGAAMGFIIVGGNVFGMLAPIATGYVISISGSYSGAFIIAGVLLVIGMLSLLVLSRQPIGVRWGASAPAQLSSDSGL
jgi:ACS family glucarate transporter-like MFS transporter